MSSSETTSAGYDEATLVDELTRLRRTGLRRKRATLPTLEAIAAVLGDSRKPTYDQIKEAIAAGADKVNGDPGKAVTDLLNAGAVDRPQVQERRRHIAKLLGYSIKYVEESIEPELIKALAAQLLSLAASLLDSEAGADEPYLHRLAQAASDLHYTCRAVFFVLVHDAELTRRAIPLGRSGFPLMDYLFQRYLAFAYAVYPMPDPYSGGLCFADFFLANRYRRHLPDDAARANRLADLWRRGANATPLGQDDRSHQERLRLALIAAGGDFSTTEPLYAEQWSAWLTSIGTPLFDSLQLLRKLGPLIATSGAVAFLLKRQLKLDAPVGNVLEIASDVARQCYPQLNQESTALDISHYFVPESKDLVVKLLPEVAPEEVLVF
jgi:hypothetical protein